MPERSVNSTLRTSLLNNDGFAYAHLVKFEKPSLTSQVEGAIAGKATDYAYITDAAQDIVYNDGSTDSEGNVNGAQTYRANRLVSVGTVSETTEARASNMALKLYATTLGTTVEDSLNISSGSLAGTVSFSDEGFREGDKVLLTGGGSNNGKYVIINAFSNAGKTIAVTPVDTTLSTESSATYTLSLASEEITALLLNKSSTGYASFLNREVYVYKAHLSAEDNSIIGEPYLIFKGIVSNGTIQEKPDGQSTVSWNLTSHWGDFVQVRGRITSDAFHRALDPTGRPDRDGLIRPEYANDLGFLHSERAVNLISTYQVKETRYRKQTKSGFLGFNKKISFIPYEVEVDREVDLRFNLQAKYLPVVYGVQRVDSIPFFVDTLLNDPKQIYTGYAIAEGEIGGIYDIYFDDTPSICIDKNDFDARSTQTSEQTIDVLCKGRADRGDTLQGGSYFSGTFNAGLASNVPGLNDWEIREAGLLGASLTALSGIDFSFLSGLGAQTSGTGITHEKGHSFTTPIDTSLTFHAGKPFQKANSVLATTAASNSFKIQNDYYDNEADYWGANHRLLDTAYIVGKYTISEGETQIPELDFVVRGKLIDCYNYDYSYAPDLQNDTSHDESLFELLDSVTLHNTNTDAQIGSTVQIIDKWSFQDETGTTQYRFRFSENPSLGSVKQFYMKNGSGDRWYFETYDYSPNSGTVPETLDTTISTASNNATAGVDLALSSPTLAAQAAFRYGNSLNITDGQFDEWYNSEFDYVENIASNVIEAVGQANASTFNATTAIPANAIALASSASTTDDIYNGYKIRLTRFDANGVPYVQERIITDYIGTERVAIVDSKWDGGKTPVQGDSYEILSIGDKRVSINPAMQLLDYIISPRYGKGLSLADDISLASFQDSARLCDTRSNVFMQAYGNAITDGVDVGDVFKYTTSGGTTVFQGKVKKLTYHSGPNSTEVEFEEVVGKIARKWENWKTFSAGDLYWHDGTLYVASSNGLIGTPSSNSSQGTTTLVKVSGTGTVSNWSFNTLASNFDGNPIVKAYDSATDRFKKTGYSLYDSDDVKYWRYVGWDAQEQRYVTRHQTNFVIDTSKPVFDNINGMLNHFNGILRYANGRYELDVESSAGVLSEAQYIDTDDIIGEIKITDSGQKGVFNSVSAAIPDPQNRFDNRTVTFFNSQYLKEDRGVPKQGNFNLPGVTNYFNARINVKQFLDQSRYSLSINFTMMPKGVLLLAGSLISITYPRFGWTNKLFRISNLNFTSECLAQVTAEEHNDDAYLISGFNKEYYNNYEPAPIVNIAPAAPTGLTATGNERGGITLTWTNGTNFNPTTFVTEVWRSSTNNRANATLIGTTKGTTFTDAVTTEGAVTRYYWIRHSVSVLSQLSSQAAPREVFSTWYPVSATAGESGTSVAILDAVFINLSRVAVALPSDVDGNVSDFSGSGTDITVTQGTTKFEYDGSGTPAANTFSVTAASPGSVVTFDSTPTTVNDGSGNPTIRRYDDITALSATAGAVVFTVTVNFGNSVTSQYTVTQSLSKVAQGVDGDPGDTGPRTASGFLYYQSSSTTAPSAPSASGYSYSTGQFSSLTTNWDENAPTFAAGNSNKYWYVRFTVEENEFEGTQSVSIGSVLQGIGFSGLVTFSSGSLTDGSDSFDPDSKINTGGAASDVNNGTTTIDGDFIRTGSIESTGYVDLSGVYSSAGMRINLDNGSIKSEQFAIDSSGNAYFKGTLNIGGTDITYVPYNSSNPDGYTDDTAANAAQSTANTAQSTANTANNKAQNFDTNGNIISPISLSSTGRIATGKTAYGTGTGWLMEYNNGTPRLDIGSSTNYVRWNGSSLSIAGNLTILNASSIDAGDFNNNLGWTDDTAADTAQSTADTAQSTANTAQSTANTANSTANTANSRAQNFNTSGDVASPIELTGTGKISSGKTAYGSGTGWLMEYNSGTPRLDIGSSSNYVRWNGSGLFIKGNITIDNASSINAGDFNNNLGWTDDTAADAAQSTANTANSTATTANSRAQNFNTSGNLEGGVTVISGGSITVGNIFIDGDNGRILITD
jgi:hypothetical protein